MAANHHRAALLAALLVLCAAVLGASPAHAYGNRVTAYLPTGNLTYYGYATDTGVAACSWKYPAGTQIQFWDGFVVTCLDRGLLDENGVDIDIFAWNMSEVYYFQARYSGTNYYVICWGYCGYG